MTPCLKHLVRVGRVSSHRRADLHSLLIALFSLTEGTQNACCLIGRREAVRQTRLWSAGNPKCDKCVYTSQRKKEENLSHDGKKKLCVEKGLDRGIFHINRGEDRAQTASLQTGLLLVCVSPPQFVVHGESWSFSVVSKSTNLGCRSEPRQMEIKNKPFWIIFSERKRLKRVRSLLPPSGNKCRVHLLFIKVAC